MNSRPNLLLVFPDDFSRSQGSDIEHYRQVLAGSKAWMDTSILDFPVGQSPSFSDRVVRNPPLWFGQLLRALIGKRFRLGRRLLRQRGLVYVGFLPVVLVVLFFRRALCLHYAVICHTVGMPDRSDSLGTLLYHLVAPVVFKACDGVVCDEFGPTPTLVRRYAKRSIAISIVSVESRLFAPNQHSRETLRKRWGIEGQFAVGIVGPFFGPASRCIEYVKARLDQFLPNITFLFIGDIPRGAKVNHPRMIFTGRVAAFPELLGAVDCLLIPRFQYIGSPMRKMVYAMAAGLPVVTNNPEGMRVKNGVHAIICSLDEMPSKINLLATNPSYAKSIGAEGKLFVETFHSASKMITEEMDFFFRILSAERKSEE